MARRRKTIFALKEKVEPMTWQEARLKKGPIVVAIEKELWEGNYQKSARYLHCLAQKEQSLIDSSNISESLSNNPDLLLQLFHHFKTAEGALRTTDCDRYRIGFTHIYEALKLVLNANTTKQYNWLIEDLFNIVEVIFENHWENCGAAKELIALTYALYGSYLLETDNNCEQVIPVLEKTVALSLGESWQIDRSVEKENYTSIHSMSSAKLIKALICRAKILLPIDPARAEELSHKTITFLLRSHQRAFRVKTYYERAVILIERDEYKEALQFLIQAKKLLICDCTNSQSIEFGVRLDLSTAICLDAIDMVFFSTKLFDKALYLARENDLKAVEADIFYQVGKRNLKRKAAAMRTRKALKSAETLYGQLGNREGVIKAGFLLAKLCSETNFPLFSDLIKCSDKPCPMLHLRSWKDAAIPFWNIIHVALYDPFSETRSIDCLLKEHDEPEAANISPLPLEDINDKFYYKYIF